MSLCGAQPEARVVNHCQRLLLARRGGATASAIALNRAAVAASASVARLRLAAGRSNGT